ncbi:MAG: AAA family ATPase [Anaerolineae bacterium]
MLTRLGIHGFKSLYDVEVPLGQVNVLVGANGSGKSNLLEAVGLLAASASRFSNGIETFIRENRASYNQDSPQPERPQESEDFYDQELLQRGVRPGIANLFLSSFPHKDTPESITLFADLKSRTGLHRYETQFLGDKIRDGALTASRSTLAYREGTGEEEQIKRHFERLRSYVIYFPNTPVLRGTQPDITQRLPIGLAGGRLAEAVDELLDSENATFGTMVLEDLLELLDWVDEIAVVPPSKDLISPSVPTTRSIIRFTDRWMRQDNHHVSAYDASEGALYVLFALVIAMHPQSPQFFAIDNFFDQAMHPRLARATMRVFSQQLLETQRQALITTHNPLVLDGLDLRDDRIRLFAVERNTFGATKVYRVQVSDEVIEATENGLSLSNLWVMGRLGGVPDIF